MIVIGLTGGIGCGKTTVANFFAEKGIPIIDTDQIARQLTETNHPNLLEISRQFGPEVLRQDGSLDRSALRKIIFSDDNKKIWLEKLLHPLIRLEVKRQIDKVTTPYCIVVIPLLFETDANPYLDRILVVDAPVDLQIKRIQARDHCSLEEAKSIIAKQVSREERINKADDLITNTDSLAELKQQVEKLHRFYPSLSGES